MDILSKLPFLTSDSQDQPVAEALSDAEAKKQRIEFHRTRVRNGPANFSAPTAGQERRARKRALAGATRRARRRQVRQHLANQTEAATLGAHLRQVGILAFALETTQIDPVAARRSTIWIVQRYAEGDETGAVRVTREVVLDALEAALNRYQELTGQPITSLSPAYVLPVHVVQ